MSVHLIRQPFALRLSSCGTTRSVVPSSQLYTQGRKFLKHRQARSYASAATQVSPSVSGHDAATSHVAIDRSTVDTVESSTSQTSLQAQARELESLLIDGTGRNPGKQRQISWSDQEGGAEEEEQWIERLEWAAKQASQPRKTVVAVLGNSSEDLARFSQALLSDPLASDQRPTQALAARVQAARKIAGKEQVRTLRYGATPSNPDTSPSEETSSTSSAAVSSRYLADNALEIRELLFDTASSLSPQLWTSLLTSDVVIVQAEPPSSSDIYRLLQKKNVIFTSSQNAEGSSRIFEPVSSKRASSGKQVMPIDLDRAVQANSYLQAGANHSLSAFSAMSLHSGIPQLSEHIANLAASSNTRMDTVNNILARAVLDMASNLAAAHQLLYEAEGKVGRLALTTARDKKHSEIELGFTDLDRLDLEQLVSDTPPRIHGKGTAGQTAVIDSKAPSTPVTADDTTTSVTEVVLLPDGTQGVETALNNKRLSWWKLPLGRADDISTDLAISLSTYFAGLERKLIFETGRLAERSLDLSLQVNTLLKSPPFARPNSKTDLSYYSATMENEIARLSPTTQFGFPPPSHPSAYNLSQTSLSAPIESRRIQLKAPGGAIERLQLRAQQSVVGFYSLSGVSTAAAVFLNQTSWLQLQQDVPFCVGFAGLGIAAAAWRLQGGWKKAKGKFWIDWKRAQEGLAFELQANADDVLSHKVFVKADIACKVLRKHLAARKDALRELESRLRQAQQSLTSRV